MKKKLIEVVLPFEAINTQSARMTIMKTHVNDGLISIKIKITMELQYVRDFVQPF